MWWFDVPGDVLVLVVLVLRMSCQVPSCPELLVQVPHACWLSVTLFTVPATLLPLLAPVWLQLPVIDLGLKAR